MKKLCAVVFLAFLAFPVLARGGHGGGSHGSSVHSTKGAVHHSTKSKPSKTSSTNTDVVHVNSYVKKDGTLVQAHDRTIANETKNDNWSTKGNVNPETGAAGTKPRDGEKKHH